MGSRSDQRGFSPRLRLPCVLLQQTAGMSQYPLNLSRSGRSVLPSTISPECLPGPVCGAGTESVDVAFFTLRPSADRYHRPNQPDAQRHRLAREINVASVSRNDVSPFLAADPILCPPGLTPHESQTCRGPLIVLAWSRINRFDHGGGRINWTGSITGVDGELGSCSVRLESGTTLEQSLEQRWRRDRQRRTANNKASLSHAQSGIAVMLSLTRPVCPNLCRSGPQRAKLGGSPGHAAVAPSHGPVDRRQVGPPRTLPWCESRPERRRLLRYGGTLHGRTRTDRGTFASTETTCLCSGHSLVLIGRYGSTRHRVTAGPASPPDGESLPSACERVSIMVDH